MSRVNISSFDRIFQATWEGQSCKNETYTVEKQKYCGGCYREYITEVVSKHRLVCVPATKTFSRLNGKSNRFKLAGNISRDRTVNSVEHKEYPNEITFTADIKLPSPIIQTTVNVYIHEPSETAVTLPVTAFSTQDFLFNMSYILNRKWQKIFVTEITPISNSTFRTSFKCDPGMTYDFCLELQTTLNDSVFKSIEPIVAKTLRFKLEELEPVIT